jgi:hypothetical protein
MIYKNSVHTSQETHYVFFTNTIPLMLFREIISLLWESYEIQIFCVTKQVVYMVTTVLLTHISVIRSFIEIPLHCVCERDRTAVHSIHSVQRSVFTLHVDLLCWALRVLEARSTDLIFICVTAPVSALAREAAELTCSTPTPGRER